MVSNKKRKISQISDFRPLPSSMETHNRELVTSFEKFEDAMCDLLASASVVTNLQGALGDEKANFIFALQHMVETGDLPWVREIDSDGEEVTHDTEEGEDEDDEDEEDKVANGAGTTDDEVIHGTEMSTTTTENTPTEQWPDLWPPPLPPISNHSLRLQIFTPSIPDNEDQPQSHYQRLEWLGDAYLEAAVSRILYDRFPDAREGALTVFRQSLVTNRFISHLAALYGFENRIIGISDLPSTRAGVKKVDLHWKLLADCFEAYVAGIVLSDPRNTLETLTNWLAPLYEPEIIRNQHLTQAHPPKPRVRFPVVARVIKKPGFKRMRSPSVVQPLRLREHPAKKPENVRARGPNLHPGAVCRRSARLAAMGPRISIIIDETESDWEEIENPEEVAKSPPRIPLNDNAKIHLRSILGGDGVALNYVRTILPKGKQGDRFSVTVFLTGWGFTNRELGRGRGVTEYEAGQRAAMAVLKDKDLLITLKQQKACDLAALDILSLGSAMKDQLGQSISSIPTYNPGFGFQTASPVGTPAVIQYPWIPVLPSVWEDTDGIISSPVKCSSAIQALREDLHDLIMIDRD